MNQYELAKKLNTTGPNLNQILLGKRGITKKRALEFEKICKELGYNFTAQDWIFEPNKIRTQLFILKGTQK
jgi:plasmid maintenance system antidote protein VapI